MTVSPTDDLASAECRIQELIKELAQARGDLAEAREQQAATAETLRVISSSPKDLKRVFAEVAMSAARLCDAYDVAIHQVNGDLLPLVAHYGPIPVPASLPLTRGVVAGRAVLDRRTIQIADMQAEIHDYPEGRDIARRHGLRTNLAVPLIRVGEAVGVITLRRSEVKPFTERQTELAKIFADQAVIAIENFRLLNETQEALDQQKASADVLAVISSSITDARPVFDRIVASCERLFAGKLVGINLMGDDGVIRAGAYHGRGREEYEKVFPLPLSPDTGTGRAILERRVLHYPDVMNGRDVPEGLKRGCATTGVKACLIAPLLWEGRGLGAIFVGRDHVGGYSERDIALLKTFADQAVIAIENTRLFEAEQASKHELQESLEYQSATSEVLSVISHSPTDLQPVFDAIARSALHLCGGTFSSVLRFDGRLIHFVAAHGMTPEGFEALRNTYPLPPGRAGAATRAIESGALAEIPDVDADSNFAHRHIAGAQNFKSVASVPMLKDGRPIGTITVGQAKTGRLPPRQIALLRTFADQAVIAIENTRLFEAEQASKRELTEALEQQTATADVLKVISRSALDVQKVLDALVESAARL